MKTQAARSILAIGLVFAVASAAFAGPTPGTTTTTTPGTTTTTTTTPGSTTTTTTTPGTTTTTTTTTTPGTTTTAPPTTTTSSTTTTTTTLPPGNLSGERFFVDVANFEKNQTLLDVDTATGSFCLAGRAVGVDGTVSFNRRVVFTYRSLGTITKATDKKVNGEFLNVELRLTIDELCPEDPVNCPVPRNEFDGVITTGCRLKGSLQKEGDAAKAKLQCDVGENLSAFGLPPSTQQNLVENVTDAFTKRKNLKVNTKKGKIRFTHRGEPAPPDLEVPPTLNCDPGGNNAP